MAVGAVGGGGGSDGFSISGSVATRDAFLQLLVTQLRNQDPVEPVSNTDFLAQLAQFGTLEQIGSLSSALLGSAAAEQLLGAGALIGKSVDYTDEAGETQSGLVQSVGIEEGAIVLGIDGKSVPLGTITKISEPPAPSE